MELNNIAVIGAGAMGRGIAQVAATSGIYVTMIDTAPTQLEQAQTAICKSVERLHSKGRLTDKQRSDVGMIETSG